MKKLFGMFLSVSLLAIFGCGERSETQKAGPDIQVQIPLLKEGKPGLEVVTLKGVSDLRRVSGTQAVFYYAPRIEGNKMFGEQPLARFLKNSNDVYVPLNVLSAEMATIYYHVQNLKILDQRFGLGSVNSGPRKVALSTRIAKDNEWVRDGAFYDNGPDALIFVDFSQQSLPLTINPGVVAHEHFHSIFFKLGLQPLLASGKVSENVDQSSAAEGDVANSLYEFALLKALNEGLSDFWGWLYSADENFVARSLPQFKDRGLGEPLKNGFSHSVYLRDRVETMVKDKLNFESMKEKISLSSYSMGNRYARFFRHLFAEAKEPDQVVEGILSVVKGMNESYQSSERRDFFEPKKVIEMFRLKNEKLAKEHCQTFANAIGTKCED